MIVDVETYMDKKTALVNVEKPEIGNTHRSVPTNGEEIVAYEEILENYPSWAILVFRDAREYLNEIKRVDWIVEEVSDEELETIGKLIKEG